MSEYDEHWITTYTGKKFHYLNPLVDEITIIDIAHALALTCRFGGHCSEYYSVAEHSIRVADIVPEKYRLHALLHDAGEAYIPDIPRPIKYDYPEIKDLEEKLFMQIFVVLGNSQYNATEIKYADSVLLATEARDLMITMEDWAELPPALEEKIIPTDWQWAEKEFLNYYHCLKGGLAT